MGRNAKPVSLLLAEGKKHLTKAEINERQEQEESMKSGISDYKANQLVLENKQAYNMFKKLKKLYKNIDYIDGLDENIINRYCLLSAEENSFSKLINKMDEDVENCEEFEDRVKLYKTIASATSSLNKIRDMLLKIEDRLLLNPTARIKNVPKKDGNEENKDSKWSKFGG